MSDETTTKTEKDDQGTPRIWTGAEVFARGFADVRYVSEQDYAALQAKLAEVEKTLAFDRDQWNLAAHDADAAREEVSALRAQLEQAQATAAEQGRHAVDLFDECIRHKNEIIKIRAQLNLATSNKDAGALLAMLKQFVSSLQDATGNTLPDIPAAKALIESIESVTAKDLITYGISFSKDWQHIPAKDAIDDPIRTALENLVRAIRSDYTAAGCVNRLSSDILYYAGKAEEALSRK